MRRLRKGLGLLSAGVIGLGSILGSGCADYFEPTVSYGSTFMRPTGRVLKKPTGYGEKEKEVGSEHEYVISARQNKSNLEIKVTDFQKSIVEVSGQHIENREFAGYRTMIIEEPNPVLLGISGILLCVGIFGRNEESVKEAAPAMMIGGGIGLAISPLVKSRRTSESRTGKTEYREGNRTYGKIETRRKYLGDFNGSDVKVKVSSSHFSFDRNTFTTDNRGRVNVRLKENIPYWAFSESELEKELRKDLAKVNKKDLDFVVKMLLKYVEERNYPVDVKTVAKSYLLSKKVKNDKKRVDIKGYGINKNVLKTIVGK